MIDDEIMSSFTEEERKLLFDIYAKISLGLEKKLEKQNPVIDEEKDFEDHVDHVARHQYDELERGMSKLDSPVELIFVVNCIVYEKNTKGEVVNHNDILVKNYHVPLENQDQIKEFIELFFRKFAQSTEETCREVIK